MADLPRVMIFPLTMQCNSHCRSCGIWKLPRQHKLHAGDRLLDAVIADEFLAASVESVNLTGGEPVAHPRFGAFARDLVDRYDRLKEICLNTDGHLMDPLESALAELLPECARRAIALRVYVSVDGLGARHDEHRRHRGAFALAERALARLRDLRRAWPETLFVTASFTITDANVDQVVPAFRYSQALDVRIDFMLAAKPEIFIGGAGLDRDCQVRNDRCSDLRAAMAVVCSEPGRSNFSPRYYETMLGALEQGRRTRGCFFPSSGFVLMPDGKAYICGTYRDFFFGDLLAKPFEALWRGALRASCRAEKIPGKCQSCLASSYQEWDDVRGACV